MKNLLVLLFIIFLAFTPAEHPNVKGSLNLSGAAIKDIDVSLRKVPGNQIVATTKTNEKGSFVFESVEPGNYEIVFSGIQVCPPTNSISGKLMLGQKLFKNTDIHFYNENAEQVAATVTDARGNFIFEGFAQGKITMIAQLPSSVFN